MKKQESKPLVTVIVPIYNVELYIRECLESLVQQTLENIEIICVNDGTQDKSGEIAEEFSLRDLRIKVISQKNGGLSAARNLGIRNAKAEYIQFVDPDDYVEKTFCEKLYNAIIEHNADVAICGLTAFYEKGQEYRDKKSIDAYYNKNITGLYLDNATLIQECLISVCIKIFKKSLIEEYGIYFLEGKKYEDNFFTPAYLSISKTTYIMVDKLYYRRFRNDSITDDIVKARNADHIDTLYQLEHLYLFFIQHSLLTTDMRCYFWDTYLGAVCFIRRYLKIQYLPQLFDMVAFFVECHQESIPNDLDYTEKRKMLLEYISNEGSYNVSDNSRNTFIS